MENLLPERLSEERKKHGLSQETLAEKMQLSRQAISKWERGESSPDTENLITLSKIYGVSIDELLGHDLYKSSTALSTEEDVLNAENDIEKPVISDEVKSAEQDEKSNDEKTQKQKKKILSPKKEKTKKEKEPILYPRVHSVLLKIPVAVAVPVVFVVLGMLKGLWHPYWLMMLIIPVYYLVCFAFKARSIKSLFLRMPIWLVTVAIFLYIGFCFSLWKYAWLIFLVNLIYYWFAFSVSKKKKQ